LQRQFKWSPAADTLPQPTGRSPNIKARGITEVGFGRIAALPHCQFDTLPYWHIGTLAHWHIGILGIASTGIFDIDTFGGLLKIRLSSLDCRGTEFAGIQLN